MTRTSRAILSTTHLINNINVVRSVANNSKIIAMVKANAYGHGIRSVAKRIAGYVDLLGVASIDEAVAIRKIGIDSPIILMEGVFCPSEYEDVCRYDLEVVFHARHQIDWLRQQDMTKPIQAWLKIDTGMGRLGFDTEAVDAAYQTLYSTKQVKPNIHILSHLSCAKSHDSQQTLSQLSSFKTISSRFSTKFSLCNSDAIFLQPEHHYDYVRPGMALYGIGAHPGLKPVMTLQAQIISIKQLQRGQSIGYGQRYICQEAKRIAIASIGYGDGYPQSAPDGTPVLINGNHYQLAGRVSMDMLSIDLDNDQRIKIGDWVTLWGEGLSIETVAKHTSSSAYELTTRVQNRVPFQWIDQ
ncbi:MAG: alanine racemase [Legionellales bacterium]|mgnify:CR=1 FL=1|nr:alanine racemase [Legionellales bacterium]|tara:strand:+ start:1965 stop:3029 length:1065 start_codon:yes stop_codon:yes gene_type:complete